MSFLRGKIAPFACLFLLISAVSRAEGERVRVLTVNGFPVPAGGAPINVNAGDVVSISADVVRTGGACNLSDGCPEQRDAREFLWSANDRPSDQCAPSGAGDCLDHSNFHFVGKEVNFYLPYSMSGDIIVSVSWQGGGNDRVSLHNLLQEPPTQVVLDPTHYPYPRFDAVHALAGMGRWIVIYGNRYWVPQVNVTGWTPYQHGYWTYVSSSGLTWVSYDAWGWLTDHYGVWRHNVRHGWVWMPAQSQIYAPAAVTWFHNGSQIGWFPYHGAYGAAYQAGRDQGFNDGFEKGYESALADPKTTTAGFTVIPNKSLRTENLAEVALPPAVAVKAWQDAYRAKAFGDQPGAGSQQEPRAWLEARAGARLPETSLKTFRAGDQNIQQPVAVHPVPQSYLAAASGFDLRRNIPVRASEKKTPSLADNDERPRRGGRAARGPRRRFAKQEKPAGKARPGATKVRQPSSTKVAHPPKKKVPKRRVAKKKPAAAHHKKAD